MGQVLYDRLKKALLDREKHYGISTEAFLSAWEQDLPVERNPDFLIWRKDHEELQIWEQRLREYKETLQILHKI